MPYDPDASAGFEILAGAAAGGGAGAAAVGFAELRAGAVPGGAPVAVASPVAGLPGVLTVSAPAGVAFDGAWASVKFSTRMRAYSVHLPSGYCLRNAW